jgi:hypothetical protein
VVNRDPIILVHGNGDHAALFLSTAWRFESNGWPGNRLFAFDLPHLLSRDLDQVAQPERSSALEYAEFHPQRIADVLGWSRRTEGDDQTQLKAM